MTTARSQRVRPPVAAEQLTVRDWWVWSVVIVMGAADCATTAIGLSMGFAESNPVVQPLLDVAGVPALIVLKALIIMGVYVAVRRLPRPAPTVTAHALSLVWALAVGINTAAILSGGPV